MLRSRTGAPAEGERVCSPGPLASAMAGQLQADIDEDVLVLTGLLVDDKHATLLAASSRLSLETRLLRSAIV